MVLFWDSVFAVGYDPGREEPKGGYRILPEFFVGSREIVDARYGELVAEGYRGHKAPFETHFGAYMAMVDAPDGNTVLLTAGLASNRPVTERRGMTQTERETVARLREIPNVGPKMAADLLKLGVRRLEDAAGRDPDDMYHELCALDARRHDPCVRDVFAAVVSYAEGGPARPWWEFTPERKNRDAKQR